MNGIQLKELGILVIKATLPWNFPKSLWKLAILWVATGALVFRLVTGAPYYVASMVTLVASTLALALTSILLSVVPQRLQRTQKTILVLATLSAPLVPLIATFLAMMGFMIAGEFFGRLTNEPYSRCAELPTAEELPLALASGFDVNRKCCREGMIGECATVRETNRNAFPLDEITLYRSDEEVTAYVGAGAHSTPLFLANAAMRETPVALRLALERGATNKQKEEALWVALQHEREENAQLLRAALPSSAQEETFLTLKMGALNSLSQVISAFHYDPDSDRFASILQTAERERLTSPEFLAELLCQLVRRPRNQTNGRQSGELLLRFDRAASFLLEKGANPNYLCGALRKEPTMPLWLTVTKISGAQSVENEGAFNRILKALLLSEANVTAKDQSGRTWMSYLSCRNRKEASETACKMVNRMYQIQTLRALGNENSPLPLVIDGVRVDTKAPLDGF